MTDQPEWVSQYLAGVKERPNNNQVSENLQKKMNGSSPERKNDDKLPKK
jgi:hypothetical protein